MNPSSNKHHHHHNHHLPVQTELDYFPLPGQFIRPRVLKKSHDFNFISQQSSLRSPLPPNALPSCAFPFVPAGLDENLTIGNSDETASVELVALRRQLKSALAVVQLSRSCPRLLPGATTAHAAKTLTAGADTAAGVRALRSLQSDAQLRLGAPTNIRELRPVSAATVAIGSPTRSLTQNVLNNNSPFAMNWIGEPNWRNVVYATSRLDQRHRENRRALRKIRREDLNEYETYE